MTREAMNATVAPAARIGAAMLVVAALYWGRPVLVPLVFAALLSFLLAPIADWLEHWHVPAPLSVVLTAVTTFVIVIGIGSVITVQTVNLAKSLPQYHQNIEQRFQAFQSDKATLSGRFRGIVEGFEGESNTSPDAQARHGHAAARGANRSGASVTAPGPLAGGEPVPVTIQAPAPSAFGIIKAYAAPILGPVGTAGLIAVFVVFMLLQRDDLRDRMIRLMGTGHLDITTRALAESGERVSRYLLMQLIINVTYGIPIGIGLWLIGVPGAALWGLAATVLRFIPYIGVWLAACLPFALSLAVFHGWLGSLGVVGLFVVVELAVANVMEPWLYGSSTGMSPLGVLVAVVFWSTLWGPAGLVLAIPLTTCLVVAGRYISQLEVFAILLGREPALSPVARFYQRLLAGDEDEAEELADEHVEQHGLVSLYDELMIPALHLAESDRHAGKLDAELEQTIRDTCRAIAEDLVETTPPAASGQDDEATLPPLLTGTPVLCVPARDEADALAAYMFAHVLGTRGVAAEAVSQHVLASEITDRISAANIPLICISALPPGAISHTRYLCKRLHQRFPGLRIVVGLWNVSGNLERMSARLTDVGADHIVTTFEAGAIELVRSARHIAGRGSERSVEAGAEPTVGGAAVTVQDS
jgi:predicted PurR-regulated permease PerM